ncbi:hypothetical protein [Desulfosporosinus sp. BG]|uniref:hypothetical protein n=1 Tax=Desulfosporosinus sp. BG TaxID=1633135 RepID=UPI00159F3313|nr:hypothetical protein [Desulfosporosinus sp. BG]
MERRTVRSGLVMGDGTFYVHRLESGGSGQRERGRFLAGEGTVLDLHAALQQRRKSQTR